MTSKIFSVVLAGALSLGMSSDVVEDREQFETENLASSAVEYEENIKTDTLESSTEEYEENIKTDDPESSAEEYEENIKTDTLESSAVEYEENGETDNLASSEVEHKENSEIDYGVSSELLHGTCRETYYLSQLEKGDLMMWDVCSQCSNTFSVTIEDDDTVYATIDKDTAKKELDIVGQDSAIYQGGDNLRVVVQYYPLTVEIKTAKNSGTVKNEQGTTIGHLHSFSLEDGDDGDFNDAVITIKSWKMKD